LEILENNFTVS